MTKMGDIVVSKGRGNSVNSLPEDIRNLTGCSIDQFKSQLDGYLHTIPDEPQITGYTAS